MLKRLLFILFIQASSPQHSIILNCGASCESQCIQSTDYKPAVSTDCSTTDSPSSIGPITNISRVSVVNEPNNTAQLLLEWTVSAGSASKLRVVITSVESDSLAICKTYYLSDSETTNYQGKFSDQCLTAVVAGGKYEVKTYTGQAYKSYLLFIPNTLGANEAVSWKPPLLVSYNSRIIEVIISNIPVNTNSRRYRLTLAVIKNNGIVLEESSAHSWLLKGETKIIFNTTGAKQYSISLYDCGRNEDTCSTENLLQTHQFDTNLDMSSVTSEDTVVKVSNVSSGQLREEDMYILIGTIAGGVFLGILIISVLVFIYMRKRRQQQSGLQMRRYAEQNVYGNGLIALEDLKESPPSVLVIYSYDCQSHMASIQSFAFLLQNVFGCTVMADFWAYQEVTERGIIPWLQHKLATVNYIVVICSTGARFKSATSRKAHLEQESDDAYIAAMSMLQINSSLYNNKKVAVYFDYASESDIPAQLESWPKFKLPEEMDAFTSVFDFSVKDDPCLAFNSRDNLVVDTLAQRVEECKQYMADNPDWLHYNLHSQREERPCLPTDVVTVEPCVTIEKSDFTTELDFTNTEKQQGVQFSEEESWVERQNKILDDEKSNPSSIALRQTKGNHDQLSSHPTVASIDSLSSVDDLDEDINFILNTNQISKSLCTKDLSYDQVLFFDEPNNGHFHSYSMGSADKPSSCSSFHDTLPRAMPDYCVLSAAAIVHDSTGNNRSLLGHSGKVSGPNLC